MREILFRGQRLDNGEWVEGSLVIYNIESIGKTEKIYKISDITQGTFPNDFMSGFEEQVDPITVGQFTGLLDKNGKKIFEGDKVHVTGVSTDVISSVVFEDGTFTLDDKNNFTAFIHLYNMGCDIEVIGTIYDKE